MTAHKVSTWGENKCGEINTSSHGLSLHFSAPVKYRGRVLGKRSLAGGAEEMESFVRHPKTSEGITDGEEGGGLAMVGFLFFFRTVMRRQFERDGTRKWLQEPEGRN